MVRHSTGMRSAALTTTIALALAAACGQTEAPPTTTEDRVECLTAYVECRHRADPVTREIEAECWGAYLDCAYPAR